MSVLVVWLVFYSIPLSAQEKLELCASNEMAILSHVSILEDSSQRLDYRDVAATGDESFYHIDDRPPSWGYTRSAVWLRFELVNSGASSCERWLIVGEPRLEDVQVHSFHNGIWSEMTGGSAYPLEQWAVAARQPRFRIALGAGEEMEVLVRIASRSSMLVQPELWDDRTLIQNVTASHLIEGVILGTILLLLCVGLVIAVITRFRLLLLSCLALFFYSLVYFILNGYLFYLPSLLPWSRELIGILSMTSGAFFYAYCYLLFQVRSLGSWVNLAFFVYALIAVVVLLVGASGDPVSSSGLYSFFMFGHYPLVLILPLVAVYQGIRPAWPAWLLSSLALFQVGLWVWWQAGEHIWHYTGEHQQESVFTLIVLVLSTLMSGVVRSRQQKQEALAEVSLLQRVENERLEKKVELRTRQLREALHARSTLLARVSHDLRSPLNRIVNNVRQVRGQLIPEYLNKIERIALQQLEFIDDLLDFSRTELNEIELSLEPGYLFGFLKEIEEEGLDLASSHGNRLNCSFADNLPRLVNADFRQLRRVLVNLLHNAAKFTKEGSIELKVESIASQGGKFCIHFSVEDSGAGFSQEISSRLLMPFQRGNNVKSVEGVGLGLSIVKSLLEQMGSRLSLESSESRGSTFSFLLWLNDASEDEIDSVFLESYVTTTDGCGRSLMIVDDVALPRMFLGDLFSGYGFEVMLAADAEEALAGLKTRRIDLVITDQFMPDKDGWDLLREVRRSHPGLPVLLYSASPARSRHDTQELFFDAVLLKPSSTGDLLACIERLCPLSSPVIPQ
ncbi:hybrid sensor histidine kinase/response regulator [Marinobacter sp. ANT_B65]|uniref:hybrid sensor histidine kinase/response regulator n=1 Tax=Marinobacter sp. ANT_B65 TaxID=2039467 RepID=UPI000BBEC443|nr:hybrid sensor histidine kinase/response regulator [Marinobacter sp. ANT_B65]PCM43535.1 hybrid sensor histidine kinase/response regulator [Marinobacter sp. ANT_B65]